MDRLIEAIEDKQNPSVVGLDPTEALVPKQVVASFAEEIAEQVEDPTEAPAAQLSVAFFEFNRAIIDAVADIVPAVKPQIAMYEALGPAGIDVYSMTCEYAKQQGLYVLGDVKRGDIGSTAAAYAHHLSGVNAGEHAFDPWHEDAVTVNPYLGTDGITPFVEAATGADKDIFVLVRTSNPSSSELQELELASGERVYEHVADLVEGWGAETIGANGYSRVGAVVGYRNVRFGDGYVGRYADKTYSIDESEGNVVTLLDRIENELVNGELKPVVLSCGPLPMMKAVAAWAAKRGIEAQLSLEQRMGCGYGTCVLCTVDTAEGRLKVCSDGPVFTREQLGWGE